MILRLNFFKGRFYDDSKRERNKDVAMRERN
jgi:hypothetical protein